MPKVKPSHKMKGVSQNTSWRSLSVLALAASFDRKEKWESERNSHKVDPQFLTYHVLLHTTFLLSH